MNRPTTIAVAALTLTATMAAPAAAGFRGTVTRSECITTRQHMTKAHLERVVYRASGVRVAEFRNRAGHYRTYSYRASRSWDQSRSGVGVEFYFSALTASGKSPRPPASTSGARWCDMADHDPLCPALTGLPEDDCDCD